MEPVSQLRGIFVGELLVPFDSSKVDDCLGAEDAVQVFVQQNLGEILQELAIKIQRSLRC